MKDSPAQLIRLLARVVGTGALLAAGSVLAAPGGELDATFGENGRVTIQLANASLGMSVAQQADGRLLIGGASFTTSGASDFAVSRLNADGTRDTSFGSAGNGTVTVDFAQDDDVATSLAVQPDGKIVLAGWAWVAGYDFALARLNPDGSLDNTFGGDGRVTLDLGGFDEQVSGMVLPGGGRIVVAGFTDAQGNYDVVFARFNANGSLDTSFGAAGTTRVSSGGNHDQAFAMTRQPDGKFIACGLSGPYPYDAFDGALLAVRANQDGSVDTSYGSNGVALVQTATVLGQARSCAAPQDGTGATVLAGLSGPPEDADLALARLAPNGSLDSSFGTAGRVSIDLGGWESAENIVVLKDGKLAVAGVSFSAAGDIFLARIDAETGLLDPTFGNDGVTVLDLGHGAVPSSTFSYSPHGFGLMEQVDGKLVTVGTRDAAASAPSVFAIGRVDPAGTGNVGVVGLVETSAAVKEGTTNVRLHLRRTGGSVGEVVVDYAFVDDTAQSPGDFTGVNGSVTWADGDVADKTITIPITDDANREDDERFGVILSGASTPGLAFAATDATVTIMDDNDNTDPATLGLPVLAIGVSERGAITLEVVRSGSLAGPVSVDFATSPGSATADSDYTSKNGTLRWADGDASPKVIKVSIADDTTVEGDEAFTVSLSNPSAGATLGPNSTVTVTILDDDPGGGGGAQRFELLTPAATVSEGGSTVLSVARFGSALGVVSVDYATSSGSATACSDFPIVSGTLHWADGDSSDKTITVSTIDDTADEGVEAFTLTLSNASGASVGANSIATVTITDDDPPAVVGDGDSSSGGGSGGGGSSDRLLLLSWLLLGLARGARRHPHAAVLV